MKENRNSTTKPIHSSSLTTRVLAGAVIGLIAISFLLFSGKEADPAWGKFWMVRPLLFVQVAGGLGGAFYHLMDRFRHKGGWKKIAAGIISIIGFIFLLWIGTILGFSGTYWD